MAAELSSLVDIFLGDNESCSTFKIENKLKRGHTTAPIKKTYNIVSKSDGTSES